MTHYLDHNASTPADPRVLARYAEVAASTGANPDSLHAAGRRARALLEDARAAVAEALGGSVVPDEIVFVSGGTEANNLAVLGCGDPALPVLASAAEHASVLAPAAHRGLRELPVDAEGRVVCAAEDGDARFGLVCLVHGQNETGTMQPVAAARALADRLRAPLHVDASQSLGRMPLDEAVRVADTLTLSMHKAGGLAGSGILRVRRGVALRPALTGGEQERGARAGTPSVALAAAAALTVQLAVAEWPRRADRMRRARDAFLRALGPTPVRRIGHVELCLPNSLMLCFPTVPDGRMLLPALDLAGVHASQGSACSSGSPTPPRILSAMGVGEDDAARCVRFSFSHRDDDREAAAAGEVVRRTVAELVGAGA